MMQNKIVLDSCVFNKLFLQEHDREDALNLINLLSHKKYQILVPNLFLYEVLAVATISHFSAQKAYELIIHYQKIGLRLVDLSPQCVQKAVEICEIGHQKSGFPSFYDASYHALAIINGCWFVTADKKHISKTAYLGYIVLLSEWKNIEFN